MEGESVKPYYQEDGQRIYHADVREWLASVPSCIEWDLTLTDPPYGIGEKYASFEDSKENLSRLVSDVIPLLFKHGKRALITPGNSNQWLYPAPTWTLAWVVPAGAGANPWGFTCWQPILAYGKDPYLADCLGRRPDIFIHTETSEDWGHPCAKPIGFWKKLLTRGSCKETDIIFDPFMGSGTTLVAAKDLGRKCIGVELEEKYCEIAAKRLSQKVFDFQP
jgi:site-specific DNA-methyltransferase (adenine-specific)